MLTHMLHPTFLFETPGVTSGGGAGPVTPMAQAPTGTEPQAPSPAQGQESDFWGLFPDVPAELRPQMEPHIRQMQGHVTRLEQQLAPFKPFVDSGLTPEAASGLIRFSNDFDARPLEMWLQLGELLQQSGEDGQAAMDPSVDLEYLAAIARGEDPDATAQTPPVVGESPAGADPAVQQLIQQLQARIDELENGFKQDKTSRVEAAQDRLLEQRMQTMKTRLVEAGWPEDSLTDEALTSRVLTARGNVEAATQAMINERSSLLKGFTQTPEPGELELPHGLPGEVPETPRRRDEGDPFAKARSGATGFLRRQNRAAAQDS